MADAIPCLTRNCYRLHKPLDFVFRFGARNGKGKNGHRIAHQIASAIWSKQRIQSDSCRTLNRRYTKAVDCRDFELSRCTLCDSSNCANRRSPRNCCFPFGRGRQHFLHDPFRPGLHEEEALADCEAGAGREEIEKRAKKNTKSFIFCIFF
jgi:hypothetical protein